MFGPEVGDGRARGRARPRPDRAAPCATSRRSIPRPASRGRARPAGGCLREGARTGSAGPTATRPRRGWRLAGRHRRRLAHLPCRSGPGRGDDPLRRRPVRREIGAADIGTGAGRSCRQVAADALEAPTSTCRSRIGEALPFGAVAGGSSGTARGAGAVEAAARRSWTSSASDPADGARPGDAGTAASRPPIATPAALSSPRRA